MTRIGIILGSTRPQRRGEAVAHWVLGRAAPRTDAEFDLIDLRDHPLPHLDEPNPALFSSSYEHAHTRAWSSTIAAYDGYVLVTAEYNHGVPSPLKNALDFLYHEWSNKAVALVSYGVDGGARAAEQLRLAAGALQMADVAHQVTLSLFTEWENLTTFNPTDRAATTLDRTLDQVVAWSTALSSLRAAV
ncbi:NADPH-dependent FMN reductase [Paractinoplanes atraurantiacus]|uniref:NAD(P)H-dependent FMN reductase n=1 Tax=Paractinoplanes atraurantiacus TaxID=1036182 RepID=A0A285I8E5_9ACTN|nr:NAD(P)H-dependent oxidoreductase [Actinoplanes atraurantiacus]SNY44262.1 NAD(P)H-dependent FMN reductase [Actinoplanes atraurantiacus]